MHAVIIIILQPFLSLRHSVFQLFYQFVCSCTHQMMRKTKEKRKPRILETKKDQILGHPRNFPDHKPLCRSDQKLEIIVSFLYIIVEFQEPCCRRVVGVGWVGEGGKGRQYQYPAAFAQFVCVYINQHGGCDCS